MNRFQKDKKYIREDYKATRQIQQLQTFNNLTLKLKVSTPSNTRKYVARSIPRQVQQSLIKSTMSYISRDSNQQNMNIGFKSIVNKVKASKTPQPSQVNPSFYKQFVELQKQSKNYLCYYDKKHNHKFIQLVLRENQNKPYIILLILKDKFPEFMRSHLANRKLLALGINPDDDFERISWDKFSLLRKLMNQKTVSIAEGVKYLIRFFIVKGENTIKKDEFVSLVSSVLRPYNDIIIKKEAILMLDSVTKRMQKQQLLNKQQINLKEMKELLSKQSLFGCNDFLFILFQN